MTGKELEHFGEEDEEKISTLSGIMILTVAYMKRREKERRGKMKSPSPPYLNYLRHHEGYM